MSRAALEQLSSHMWQRAQADYDGCYGEFKPCIAVGCVNCNEGYRGRFGLFDILVMDQLTRELVVERRLDRFDSVAGVRRQGLWRIMSGHTTMEEVNRVTW